MTENQVPAWTPAGDLTAVPANDNQLRALGAAIGKTPDGSMFNRVMEMTNLPLSNPKRAFGVRKPSAQFIPPVALIEESVVMGLGAAKYGAFNWQDSPVDATTYYSAAMRHLLQWFSGEDVDKESGASHLAHVRACMAILIDAAASGKLIDDRPKCASASEAVDRLKVAA
ncbi:dATP/dGTP diphosphohydrolase domain-containing protein [Rhizobium leguminosarum]